MELFVILDRTVTVGNVTYSAGAQVPLTLAVDAGVLTDEEMAHPAVLAMDVPVSAKQAKAVAKKQGSSRKPAAKKAVRPKVAPTKASAPNRETRAKTVRHQSR